MRVIPEAFMTLELITVLVDQIYDLADDMIVSDPLDRQIREEGMRLIGELGLSKRRLLALTEKAKITPRKTDTGILVDP